jgi:hypothetical protein
MNKDLVKQNSKVSSDPVFSQESNWKLVNFVYKHTDSSRRLVSSFKSFGSSKKTKLKANMKAGDNFELHKIIISKADKSFLVLKRNEISGASDFDFSLLNDGPEGSGGSGGGGGGGDVAIPDAVFWSSNANYATELDGGLSLIGPNSNGEKILEQSFNSGAQEITFVFDGYLPVNSEIGYKAAGPDWEGWDFYLVGTGTNEPKVRSIRYTNFPFGVTTFFGSNSLLSSGTNTIVIKRDSNWDLTLFVNGVNCGYMIGSHFGDIKTQVKITDPAFSITSVTRKAI